MFKIIKENNKEFNEFLSKLTDSMKKELENNLDKIAEDEDYFSDNDESYGTNSKDLWLNKYTLKDKLNELSAHYSEDLFYYMLGRINGAEIVSINNKTGILIRKYRMYEDDEGEYPDPKLSKIRKALEDKIDGEIFSLDPIDSEVDEYNDYDGYFACIPFTKKNLNNFKTIKEIINSI